MKDLKVILFLILFVFATGNVNAFRLLSYVTYDVSPESPTVWVEFDENLINATFEENDWEKNGEENPLEGIADDQKVMEISRQVLEDYNSTDGSYLRLSFAPVAGHTLPTVSQSELDETHSETTARKRTIRISLASTSGVTAGYARWEREAELTYSCTIVVGSTKEAKSFKRTLTHEIGHCVGLAHVHSDRESVMGYNASKQLTLGIDDKMGLIYLYPTDPKLAEETATLGLACNPKK